MSKWEKMCNDLQVPVDAPVQKIIDLAKEAGYSGGDIDTWFREYRNMLDSAPIIATFTIKF